MCYFLLSLCCSAVAVIDKIYTNAYYLNFGVPIGELDTKYMCLSAQGGKLNVLLISLLMKLVIYGSLHRRLEVGLNAITMHLPLRSPFR